MKFHITKCANYDMQLDHNNMSLQEMEKSCGLLKTGTEKGPEQAQGTILHWSPCGE